MTSVARRIEYVPLGEVRRAGRNAKTHDVGWIKSLIARFGFVDAAIHDGRTGAIIAGHGRLESLEEMAAEGQQPPDGITTDAHGVWMMPVQYGWASRSDAEAEALAVALNEATTRGGWDEQVLTQTLADLDRVDADLRRVAGWDDEAFADLTRDLPGDDGDRGPGGDGDPDDVPEPPVEPLSKIDDLWLLGPHRLVCGDATDARCIDVALGGGSADCVWTDPPYGVGYVGKTGDALTIEGDTPDIGCVIRDAFSIAASACKPGATWYVASPPGPQSIEFAMVLHELGIYRQTLVWVKDQFVLGHSDYHYRHEPVFYGWVRGGAHRPPPDRAQDSVWEIPRPRRSEDHPTMKPVELVARALENSTAPGALVLDPFAGSGTTLIAAHRTRRVAALVEIDPRYVDVICRRWQEHAGELPVLASTGEPRDFTGGGAAPGSAEGPGGP